MVSRTKQTFTRKQNHSIFKGSSKASAKKITGKNILESKRGIHLD